MPSTNRPSSRRFAALRTLALLCAAFVAGCAWPGRPPAPDDATRAGKTEVSGRRADLSPYLEVLESMGSSGPDVQAATLASARLAWQQKGAAHEGLIYAIALGAPEHAGSNPVEAGRLLSVLLSRPEPDSLSGDTRRLADALRREYAARTALYAEIARQKEASARELHDAAVLSEARIEDLSADLVRTRRERDEARRKLQAITDMERQMIEQDAQPVTEGPR